MTNLPEKEIAVTLRRITGDDEAFLYRVYASTREYEMSIVPWDAAQKETFLRHQFAAQRDYYLKEYPDASYQIILLNSEPIGRIYIDRAETEIRIMDITLLPEHRNGGLGTPLVKEVMHEGAEAGKPVTIYIDSFSGAGSLFERLGFSRISDNGISGFFKWDPESGLTNGATADQ